LREYLWNLRKPYRANHKKNISRKDVHFIWNIQSRKIPKIVKHCSHIHSLANLKHAQKIEDQCVKTEAFMQIKLDPNKNIWISEEELWSFLENCKNFKSLKIIWISGMWSWDISEGQKREEFKKLVSLRNIYLPSWLISAGTSRDYEIALEEWVDVVRVGSKIQV